MNTVVELARKLIEKECQEDIKRPWLRDFYTFHLSAVVDFARMLAKRYKDEGKKVDEEIVELTAWLYELGYIRGYRGGHCVNGAIDAAKLLLEWGYPWDRTMRVKDCILAQEHKAVIKKNIEARCVIRAGMLVEIAQGPSLFARAFVEKEMSYEQAVNWIRERTDEIWKQLPAEDKLLVQERYNSIQKILEPWNR